jgi:hypothetical protein
MKKLLIINALCSIAISSMAQDKVKLKIPAASPSATFTQELGFAEITLTYERPLAKGRKIMGGLVPFGQVWRTGAGHCTLLKTSEPIVVGDKEVKAGTYALFTLPAAEEWAIILNSDTTLHGAFGYDAKKDLHRFTVKAVQSPRFYETFTIEINDINNRGEAILALIWENTAVKIPIKSLADADVMATIKKHLIDAPSKDADLFHQAANYYFTTGRDLAQARDWSLAAEKLDAENFYYPNLTTKILADLKDYKAAIEAAKRAIPLAKKKNMSNTVKSLEERIAQWEKQ